jgi:hypothetical protein
MSSLRSFFTQENLKALVVIAAILGGLYLGGSYAYSLFARHNAQHALTEANHAQMGRNMAIIAQWGKVIEREIDNLKKENEALKKQLAEAK